MSNGDLLATAELAGFAMMVTSDQNIIYQQNLTGRRIALVVLSTNHWQTIRASVDQIQTAVRTVSIGGYTYVACVKVSGDRLDLG